MSPRRKVDAQESGLFDAPAPKPPRRWGLPVVATLATLVIVAAITAATVMLVGHESDRRTQVRDAAVLDYVSGFMTAYTTLDPFHANDYTDRILAQSTGDFARMFKGKIDAIAVQVARAEPTTGTVDAAGVQRWTDNGSAEVLIAVTTSTAADGKPTIESGSRWLATATREGQQWKISRLVQVI